MKRIFLFVLTALMAFSLFSCGSTEEDTSIADAYQSTAIKYMEAQDYESAIKVLEAGISKTGDETLKQILEKVKEKYSPESGSAGTEPLDTKKENEEQITDTAVPPETETTDPKFFIENYLGEWRSQCSELIIKTVDYETGAVRISYSSNTYAGGDVILEPDQLFQDISFSFEAYNDFGNFDWYTYTIHFEEGKISGKGFWYNSGEEQLDRTESFERYNSENYTLDISSYVEDNWGSIPYCNSYLCAYVYFEAGTFGIDIHSNTGNQSTLFFVTDRNCDHRGTGIYLRADTPYGCSVTYQLKKISDRQGISYYAYDPQGTDGSLTLSFMGNGKINYKITDCDINFSNSEGVLILEQ